MHASWLKIAGSSNVIFKVATCLRNTYCTCFVWLLFSTWAIMSEIDQVSLVYTMQCRYKIKENFSESVKIVRSNNVREFSRYILWSLSVSLVAIALIATIHTYHEVKTLANAEKIRFFFGASFKFFAFEALRNSYSTLMCCVVLYTMLLLNMFTLNKRKLSKNSRHRF